MVLICVQPCSLYYAWQVEVMLTNFEQFGIHKEFEIHCLFTFSSTEHTINKSIGENEWKDKVLLVQKVQEKFKDVAKFYFYEDKRSLPVHYISSVRPNILKQHYKAYPQLSQDAVFYHDCDIIFSKFPSFLHRLTQNDNNWYVSDTKGYIGHDYILSKGEDVLDKMCEIVGINKSLVKAKQYQSGGAQYVLKGVDWVFFEKMERDCEILFRDITQYNNIRKAKEPTYHELQIWCADMWAILWNGWLRGYHTNIIPELDFCWATDNIENFDKKYIFHNAGIVPQNAQKFFYKGEFMNKLPFLEDRDYDKDSASYKYYELIKSIGENSCLLPPKQEKLKEESKSVFAKIKEIVQAYATLLNPTEEEKEWAKIRLATCMQCEHWQETAIPYCDLCNCATKGKVFSPEGADACPLKKWII